MERVNDEYYMRLALHLAEAACGQTGINPAVGCVIVRDGNIVGVGSHLEMGGPHAEIHALQMAGSRAEGSTVYVTLEPCSHFGRTPPCSDRLIREKVRRVVIACQDPNPKVAGKGIARLMRHGIDVVTGVLEREALELNEVFHKYIVTGKPFVTLKTASTLDGKIASRTKDSKWISGEQSRAYAHTLRHRHQAIMVGVDTVITDNPQLTARMEVPSRQPVRIVVDSRLRIPETAAMLHDGKGPVLIMTTEQAPRERRLRLESLGAEVVPCGNGPRVDLHLALEELGKRQIASVLLEGGGTLNGAMLENGLVDKIVLFFAPKIIGGAERSRTNFQFRGFDLISQSITLQRVKVEMSGEDVCLTGYPCYERAEA